MIEREKKRREAGSGQANEIQRAESLYCQRVCVSGRQEERNNLPLPLSLSVHFPSSSSFFFFFCLLFTQPDAKTELNYKLRNLTLALLQLLFKLT